MARVMGVGSGVFAIAFFGVLCILVCYLGSRTRKGSLVSLASTALFATIFVILVASPREDASDASDTSLTSEKDFTVIQRGVMMFVMTVGMLLAVVGLLLFHVEPPKYAGPIDYRLDVLRSRN